MSEAKEIVITGASGGLGSALIDELLFEHNTPNVVIHSGYKTTPPQFRSGAFPRAVDLCDAKAVNEWAHDLLVPWAVINLAGVTMNGMHWKTDVTDEANLLELNVVGMMNVCRAFVPGMRARGGGRIINVSSVVASAGAVGCSAYAASKAAIEGYTRAIALELAPKLITANCIALGFFNRGMINTIPEGQLEVIQQNIPLMRLGEARDLAALVRYLLSEESGYMTGQTLHLNGGVHLG